MGMKLAILVSILLVCACAAGAQTSGDGTLLIGAPTPAINQFATNAAYSVFSRDAMLAAARPAPAPAPMPQQVQGVFPITYWQASFGFTYERFYELPGIHTNTSGFDLSMAYFFKPWMAAEGLINGGFGTQTGQSAKAVFSGGGLRARRAMPGGTEVWVHGDLGGAHFEPKTNYGGEGAFGYQLGAGMDFNAHRQHMSYRVEADIVGTTFFGTYQISPKAEAAIVYKF